MTAAERARRQHWDVDCTEDRNAPGIVIATQIRKWNVAAILEAEKQRKRRLLTQ